VQRFEKKAGAIECCEIIGKKFQGWRDFQDYLHTSDKCKVLIELATSEGARAIEKQRVYLPLVFKQ
jgi:hypothetical protein